MAMINMNASSSFVVCLVTVVLTISSVAKAQIFDDSRSLEVLSSKGEGGEGPAWDPEIGLLTSGKGGICRRSADGESVIYRAVAGTNGLLFDRQGRLIACEPGQLRVTRMSRDGKLEVLTDRFNGKKYNQPNDLCLDSRGRIYFSDPRYGGRDGMEQLDEQGRTIEGVYRIDLDLKVTRILGREVERANGVLISPDDKYLFVADNANNIDGGARKLWRFELDPDGMVKNGTGKVLYDWGKGRGPDGLKQDRSGRLYVAAGSNRAVPPFEPDNSFKGGIYVFDMDGKLLAYRNIPTDEVTNCAFGGEDLKDLYVTGGGVLYRLRTVESGVVTWPNK
ncbi:MAG: Gluconolactonase precursor [Planctomycetota bacterium]